MAKTSVNFDPQQKAQLLSHAQEVIVAFDKGVVREGDSEDFDLRKGGFSFFDGFFARLTEEFFAACVQFTELASKMLKSRYAHEKAITAFCREAGQNFVKSVAASGKSTSKDVEDAASKLVDEVLAEAGREYLLIVPNFLVRHALPDVLSLGRVRSMQTDLAATNTTLSKNGRIKLEVGSYPQQKLSNGRMTLGMPASVWVVNVPATKENVLEEAKWLIDVAASLMRLSSSNWRGHLAGIGKIESHPTQRASLFQPQVIIDGDHAFTGGSELPTWYETNADVISDINHSEVQSRAKLLFDPAKKSLAQRVSQGLGWLTRGRQASDRAERLLCFFTALEALLSSDDKTAPVVQTICRYLSIIYSQDVTVRLKVFDQVKQLYSIRSAVVHAGQRDVLWRDVNGLQMYAERTFQIVLLSCDLAVDQGRFAKSLSDASHGARWTFAANLK